MCNRFQKVTKYLKSCFLLTLPVMVWNVMFAAILPPPFQPGIFWDKIPPFLAAGEQCFRILIFVVTLLMPLSITSRTQQKGMIIYVAGILLYFASWLALICYPQSAWSNSCLGFLSPALTPVFWLAGIALVSDKLYFRLPYRRWMFLAVSIAFLIFHNIHTWIIYNRIH